MIQACLPLQLAVMLTGYPALPKWKTTSHPQHSSKGPAFIETPKQALQILHHCPGPHNQLGTQQPYTRLTATAGSSDLSEQTIKHAMQNAGGVRLIRARQIVILGAHNIIGAKTVFGLIKAPVFHFDGKVAMPGT